MGSGHCAGLPRAGQPLSTPSPWAQLSLQGASHGPTLATGQQLQAGWQERSLKSGVWRLPEAGTLLPGGKRGQEGQGRRLLEKTCCGEPDGLRTVASGLPRSSKLKGPYSGPHTSGLVEHGVRVDLGTLLDQQDWPECVMIQALQELRDLGHLSCL